MTALRWCNLPGMDTKRNTPDALTLNETFGRPSDLLHAVATAARDMEARRPDTEPIHDGEWRVYIRATRETWTFRDTAALHRALGNLAADAEVEVTFHASVEMTAAFGKVREVLA